MDERAGRDLSRKALLRAGGALAGGGALAMALSGEAAGASATAPRAPDDAWLNVKSFGAVGDGVTDDAAAIRKAIDAAGKSDAVFFPPGTYACGSALSLRSKPIALIGLGMGVSTIQFTVAPGGFDFRSASKDDNFIVRDLTIITTRPNGGTALSAVWEAQTSSTWPHFVFNNLEIRGLNYETAYWSKGISVTDGWNGKMDVIHFQGKFNDLSSSRGIELMGKSVAVNISNPTIYFANVGIFIDRPAEGTVISNGNIVWANTGVQTLKESDYKRAHPQLYVLDSHMNTFIHGVEMYKRTDSMISGNLFYKEGSSKHNYAAVRVDECRDVRVTENQVILRGSGGRTDGVVVSRAARVTATGNIFHYPDAGVWFATTTSGCIASLNVGYAGVCETQSGSRTITTVENRGVGNLVVNNLTDTKTKDDPSFDGPFPCG